MVVSSFSKHFVAFLFLSTSISGCESKQPVAIQEPVKDEILTEELKSSLVLDSFTEVPPEVRGCSCYFSRNKQELQQQQYIYLNDYKKTSFISVGGKLEKLFLKNNPDSTAANKSGTYANEEFELKVEIEKENDLAEELAGLEGHLILKELKSGKVQSFPFVGECGC